jgi:hypothetical protein
MLKALVICLGVLLGFSAFLMLGECTHHTTAPVVVRSEPEPTVSAPLPTVEEKAPVLTRASALLLLRGMILSSCTIKAEKAGIPAGMARKMCLCTSRWNVINFEHDLKRYNVDYPNEQLPEGAITTDFQPWQNNLCLKEMTDM